MPQVGSNLSLAEEEKKMMDEVSLGAVSAHIPDLDWVYGRVDRNVGGQGGM